MVFIYPTGRAEDWTKLWAPQGPHSLLLESPCLPRRWANWLMKSQANGDWDGAWAELALITKACPSGFNTRWQVAVFPRIGPKEMAAKCQRFCGEYHPHPPPFFSSSSTLSSFNASCLLFAFLLLVLGWGVGMGVGGEGFFIFFKCQLSVIFSGSSDLPPSSR